MNQLAGSGLQTLKLQMPFLAILLTANERHITQTVL
jgi:hypothetical protein